MSIAFSEVESIEQADTENDYQKVIDYYKVLESKYRVEILKLDPNVTPVNFKLSMQYPRHRWFPYKEGFSPVFVSDFINRYSKDKDCVILDPFSGVGTTCLQSGMMGHKSYGFDVNPLSHFVAQVKSQNYKKDDVIDIEGIIEAFKSSELSSTSTPPDNQTVVSYFTPKTLENTLKTISFIQNISNYKTRTLFKLALLRTVEQASTHKKDGNGVKRKTRYTPTYDNIQFFKEEIVSIVKSYLDDISISKLETDPEFYLRSSLEGFEGVEQVDIVLTSPPYANCFDYSKVYLIELWLGGFFQEPIHHKEFRNSSLRSHVHASWDDRNQDHSIDVVRLHIANYLKSKNLWTKKIPSMLDGYFKDMGKLFYNLSLVVKQHGVVGIVIGNSAYAGLPIATDLLLSEQAENYGFQVDCIEVYRKLNASSQQLKLVKEKQYLRESLIILKKNA